eukprot:scaffold26585_cov131-Skeletonema_menzelii.AAC.1
MASDGSSITLHTTITNNEPLTAVIKTSCSNLPFFVSKSREEKRKPRPNQGERGRGEAPINRTGSRIR